MKVFSLHNRFVPTIATKAVIINRWAVTLTLFIKSFVGTVNWAGIITQMNLKMWTMYWTKVEKPSRTSLWCCSFLCCTQWVLVSGMTIQTNALQNYFPIPYQERGQLLGLSGYPPTRKQKNLAQQMQKNTCFWMHWKQLTRLGVWHSGFRIKHFKTSNSKARALLHCFKRTRNAFKQESSGFGQLV